MVNPFREVWPHLHDYNFFLKYLNTKLIEFTDSSVQEQTIFEHVVNAFEEDLDKRFEDYTSLYLNVMYFPDTTPNIKPKFYFAWLQLKYLKNQLLDFEDTLYHHCNDVSSNMYSYNRDLEIQDYIEVFGYSRERAEEEIKKVEKSYEEELAFLDFVVKPVIIYFKNLVKSTIDNFNDQSKILFHDLEQLNDITTDAIYRIANVFMSFGNDEVDALINNEIEGISDDYKNVNPTTALNGQQIGILASFLERTKLITITNNNLLVSYHLHVLTGQSKQEIRTALGKSKDKKTIRFEYLTTNKHDKPKYDAKAVITYLKEVIRTIEEEIED